MQNIKFSEGRTYILVIDTDHYSGNFEREMCGYVTGIYDAERFHGLHEAKTAENEAPELVASLRDKATMVLHSDYGMVSNAIRETPGRVNLGGEHRDALPGEKGWPAYESVAIFFERPLTADDMQKVTQRALAYGNNRDIGIKEVYLVQAMLRPVEETIVQPE